MFISKKNEISGLNLDKLGSRELLERGYDSMGSGGSEPYQLGSHRLASVSSYQEMLEDARKSGAG